MISGWKVGLSLLVVLNFISQNVDQDFKIQKTRENLLEFHLCESFNWEKIECRIL